MLKPGVSAYRHLFSWTVLFVLGLGLAMNLGLWTPFHNVQAQAPSKSAYKGVVTHVRVFNGELKAGQNVKLLHSGRSVEVKEVGSFNPKPYIREKLEGSLD